MSVAHADKPLSTKNKQNLLKNRSHVFSDEHRLALSKAASKRKASHETLQKMSDARRGKQHKCSCCHELGHTRPTCPFRNGENNV